MQTLTPTQEQQMVDALMRPRFKVIADYPGNPWEVGTVLIVEPGGELYNEQNGYVASKSIVREKNVHKYPAVFKPMAWYEDLEESLLPKYVKSIYGHNKGICYMVADKSQNGRIYHNDFEIEQGHLLRFASSYQPITSTEYNNYINQIKP